MNIRRCAVYVLSLSVLALCGCEFDAESGDTAESVLNDIGSAVQGEIEKAVNDAKNDLSITYLGSNDLIRSMSELLRSDKIDESMKQSRLYTLMCDIVKNDRFEVVTESIAIGYSGSIFYMADGMVTSNDSHITFSVGTEFLDTGLFKYMFSVPDKEYIVVDALNASSLFDDYSEIVDYAFMYNGDGSILIPYTMAITEYNLVESGTETIDGIEYKYENIGSSTRLYYADNKCFIGRPDQHSPSYLSSETSCPVSLPDGYSSVFLESDNK